MQKIYHLDNRFYGHSLSVDQNWMANLCMTAPVHSESKLFCLLQAALARFSEILHVPTPWKTLFAEEKVQSPSIWAERLIEH